MILISSPVEEQDQENQIEPPKKFSEILKIVKSEFTTKPYITTATVGIIATKVTVICIA